MLETASYGSPGSLTITCSGLAGRRNSEERFTRTLPCSRSLEALTYGLKADRGACPGLAGFHKN
jgi:hypothetical protein